MFSAAQIAEELETNLTRLAHSLLRGVRPQLSRTSTSVLSRLRDAGPQRITEMAAREAVAQPSMTALVTRLERQGLVRRRTDPADRRAVLVAITAAGGEVLTQRREARAAALAQRMAQLDQAHQAALAAVLPALQKLNETPEDVL